MPRQGITPSRTGTYPLPIRVVHPVDLVPGVEDRLSLGLALDLGLDLDHLALGIGLELDHLRLDLDYTVPDDHAPVVHFLQRAHRVAPVHVGSHDHGLAYPVGGSRHLVALPGRSPRRILPPPPRSP